MRACFVCMCVCCRSSTAPTCQKGVPSALILCTASIPRMQDDLDEICGTPATPPPDTQPLTPLHVLKVRPCTLDRIDCTMLRSTFTNVQFPFRLLFFSVKKIRNELFFLFFLNFSPDLTVTCPSFYSNCCPARRPISRAFLAISSPVSISD